MLAHLKTKYPNCSHPKISKCEKTDLIKLGITYGEVALETTTPNMLKVVLKNNAKTAALGELLKDISKSAKGQKLKFNQLEIQDYL